MRHFVFCEGYFYTNLKNVTFLSLRILLQSQPNHHLGHAHWKLYTRQTATLSLSDAQREKLFFFHQ